MLSSIDAVIERTPLWRTEWRGTLLRMREHPDAPAWNTECGDRLMAEDLDWIRSFEASLGRDRKRQPGRAPDHIVSWVAGRRGAVGWFQRALQGIDPGRDFGRIPTMSRSDLQQRLEEIIPADEPLDRLIVNPTSGTTGHPIQAPNHPRAIGCYDPLIQYCLRRHGVSEHYGHTGIAAVQVCFQRHTIVYNTVHSYLEGAGFAKVNLDGRQWPGSGGQSRFLADMSPVFISGDPIAFEMMMGMGVDYKPRALLSCALALSPELRARLERAYDCPVIDFYSLNETGPLAYSSPDDPTAMRQLPNDTYIEIVDDEGRPLPDGEAGEICVTGGRNPFLPLLRYRTGDRGIMWHEHGKDDDPAPVLKLAAARQPVLFRTPSGGRVNPIDISRVLRGYPVARHQCVQRKDLSLVLRLSCAGMGAISEQLAQELSGLFDNEVRVDLEQYDFGGRGIQESFVAE